MGKVRAQQQFPLFRNGLLGVEKVAHLLKAATEELADFQVAFCEFSLHLLQERLDFTVGQGLHVRANPAGSLVGGGMKRPDQHAGAIRMQDELRAPDLNAFHRINNGLTTGSWKTVTAFCMICISASESRKASVDSAPWFPLTRSTCRA